MPHAHANFVFAHHSAGKARRDQFGCAHLRLMNNDYTAIRDGTHELVLYNVSWCDHMESSNMWIHANIY